jgi:hypothetical protein
MSHQIVYSAERLKAVRISILMADYSKLVQETESIELRSISSYALDELLLVKRAISFFETLKRISICLRQGVVSRSAPGQMDTQQLSLYQLTSALASVDPKTCADPIKFFLNNASAIRSLRAAMKGGRWGTEEAAEVMIQCAARSLNQKSSLSASSASASNAMDWFGHVNANAGAYDLDQTTTPVERMLGIGLEHVGRNIRKLDYAREILGGNWRRSSSTNQEATATATAAAEMRESDSVSQIRNSSEAMESSGLSNMLLQGKLTTRIAKTTTQIGISRQEFEFQYKSLPSLSSLFLNSSFYSFLCPQRHSSS